MQIIFSDEFKKDFKRIKDRQIRLKLIKHLKKLEQLLESGKPFQYKLKGHRSTRIPPFRIIYRIENNNIIVNCFDHRKGIYK